MEGIWQKLIRKINYLQLIYNQINPSVNTVLLKYILVLDLEAEGQNTKPTIKVQLKARTN